jgi:hypothetical protein
MCLVDTGQVGIVAQQEHLLGSHPSGVAYPLMHRDSFLYEMITDLDSPPFAVSDESLEPVGIARQEQDKRGGPQPRHVFQHVLEERLAHDGKETGKCLESASIGMEASAMGEITNDLHSVVDSLWTREKRILAIRAMNTTFPTIYLRHILRGSIHKRQTHSMPTDRIHFGARGIEPE